MSEEIALASADMEHVTRLQELVNHWCIAARDLDAALQWAERERDAARAALRARAMDEVYDAWRDVRRRAVDEAMTIRTNDLRSLVAEMRQIADVLSGEIARREGAEGRADARLFRKGWRE